MTTWDPSPPDDAPTAEISATPDDPTAADDLAAADDRTPADDPAGTPTWLRGNRTIVLLAAVAVVGLVAGLGLSRLVLNPAEVAARTAAPEAGPISVPVERRTLSNDVTLRGDVAYDDAVDLRVETSSLSERAVVTGQVPEVGSTLDAGSVALEIAGRPVVVLPGDLPTYRTLRVGVSGPDVTQLKAALGALGIGSGDPGSDLYDAQTAAGVRELFQRAGYPAPEPSTEDQAALKAAQEGVRSAEDEVARANQELTSGSSGSTAAQRADGDSAVRQAERAAQLAQAELDEQRASCDRGEAEPSSCTGAALLALEKAVADAQDGVGVAHAQRSELDQSADSGAARTALNSAQRALTAAQEALTEAQAATMTALPASEVVFLQSLPRRVDTVSARRGGTVEGAVMTVSGATVQVVANASASDAALLEVGATGTIPVGDETVPVTVASIEAQRPAESKDKESSSSSSSSSGRFKVVLVPQGLTEEQVTVLQGTNVRVSVPVSSTGGDVLSVPLAALTAGPGGESRVEVMGEDGTSELVQVSTGLAAGGYVEITGSEQALQAGDLVVIGVDAEQGDESGKDAGSDG